MLSKEEFERAFDILKEQHDYLSSNMHYNYPFSIEMLENVQDCFDNLIKEHFELIEEYRKLKIALDNAIKQCCIGVTGSDACNSLDELYKAFEKKVWEDVE